MNKRLIRLIQEIDGVILVEPEFVDPQEENSMTVTITFLNVEDD